MKSAPTFSESTPVGLSGTNTGDVTLGAFGAAPSATGFSLSGQALSGQPADATHPGLMSVAAQHFGGAKVFDGALECGADLTGYTTLSSGVQFGRVSGAPGIWLLGVGSNPNTANYTLFNAGPTLLNALSGQTVIIRINNGNIATFDTGTITYAAGVKQVFDATDSSGTPGAATINKPSGQVAVASGVSSVVVTNSKVTSTSVVLAVLQDNTDAIQVRSVVPGSGTFTINLSGNTTAARKCGFVVFN